MSRKCLGGSRQWFAPRRAAGPSPPRERWRKAVWPWAGQRRGRGVEALHPLALHPLECVVDERREVEKSRQPGLDSGAVGAEAACRSDAAHSARTCGEVGTAERREDTVLPATGHQAIRVWMEQRALRVRSLAGAHRRSTPTAVECSCRACARLAVSGRRGFGRI